MVGPHANLDTYPSDELPAPNLSRPRTLALLAACLLSGVAVGSARAEPGTALTSLLASGEERLAGYFATRGIAYPPAAVTFIALKDEARLEVWSRGGGGWTFVRSYLLRAASGLLGPKLRRGDHQVPEGVYRVAALNPNSRYHLSMRLDYPNAFDLARARDDGRAQLGGDIMIHGDRVSDGCLPVGDAAVEELFALTARVGTANVAVIISPLDLRRMDARVAAARAADRRPWLGDLYAAIANELKGFPLPREDAPVTSPRRTVVARAKCKAYDAVDCVQRCRKGDLASCARAGLMYEHGPGGAADSAKAWSFLEQACSGGDALGCAELSQLYITDDGLRRDAARAAALAQAACDAGDGHGCSYLARLCVDRLTYPAAGNRCSVEFERRLYERAVAMLRKDCDGWGAYDCHALAAIYAGGDSPTAFRFATGSCQAGDPGGCYDLGRLYEDAGNTAHARELYEQACVAGYAIACERSGTRAARPITSR